MDRNKKGQFTKGHSLGFRFIKGHKRNLGKKRPDMIDNKFSCGNHPKTEFTSERMLGKNNPNWKGGISKDRDKEKESREYKNWRKKIFIKDNYTCQNCFEKEKVSGRLQAHHLYYRSEIPNLVFSVKNGITLCVDCHIKLHKINKNLDKLMNEVVNRQENYINIIERYQNI
jgi:hypothetical protein